MKLPLTVALDEDENNSAKVFNDPPSILRDDKTGELFIIELQGKLEVEQDGDDELEEHAHAGQKVGKLDMSMPVSCQYSHTSNFMQDMLKSKWCCPSIILL